MAKIQNISGIHSTLGFPEFDILENYRKSFHESELGRLHSLFPFDCMVKSAGLSDRHLGRRNIFSPSTKIALMVLKAYTGFSDRQLVEHLNGNIHYQMFCGIMINPSFPIINFKIVSAIRNEIASRLDIDSFQDILASHWKLLRLLASLSLPFICCLALSQDVAFTFLPVEKPHLSPFTVINTSIIVVPSFLTLFSLIKKRVENELLTICLIFKIRHLEVL